MTNAKGEGLLHSAADNGSLECVRLLLDLGADVEAAEESGFTPLHVAARSGQLQACCCQNRVVSRIPLSLRRTQGSRAEGASDRDCGNMLATCQFHETHTTLNQKLCKANSLSSASPEVFRLLLGAGANRHALDQTGASVLHTAAEHGQVDIMSYLLDLGRLCKARRRPQTLSPLCLSLSLSDAP